MPSDTVRAGQAAGYSLCADKTGQSITKMVRSWMKMCFPLCNMLLGCGAIQSRIGSARKHTEYPTRFVPRGIFRVLMSDNGPGPCFQGAGGIILESRP